MVFYGFYVLGSTVGNETYEWVEVSLILMYFKWS